MNVISEVLSPTSISTFWEEIPPIDRNGIITVYEVLYVPFESFDGAISANIINTTDLSYSLESLQEHVRYNISVRAYTRIGSGPYSVPIDNQTLEAGKLWLLNAQCMHAWSIDLLTKIYIFHINSSSQSTNQYCY